MTTSERLVEIRDRMWCFRDTDIGALLDAKLGNMPVLVRMGDGRTRCALDEVGWMKARAIARGSYVRDVSVCADDVWLWERLLREAEEDQREREANDEWLERADRARPTRR